MKTYKNILRVFALIFILLNTMQIAVYADKDDKGLFESKVTYGFNNYYKSYLDVQTPVKIELKNNGADVEGEVQLLFERERYDQKTLYDAYVENLELEKDATKTIDINVLIGNKRRAILKIIDKEENILFEEKVNFEKGDDIRNVSIGILSDDYDSLSFLNLIGLNEDSTSIDKKTTSMADLNGVFPEDKELLKSLNIILINDYDTENLNKKQIEALRGYIKEGGTLIVGTGSKYQKNLKGLEDINYFTPTESSRIEGYGGVLIANGSADGADAFLKEEERSVGYNKKLENGNIIILAFDLSEDKFLSWGEKNNLIKKIVNDYTNIDISQNVEMREYYNLEDMVSYIPNEDGIKGKNIVLIIIVFLILTGPVNYLLLKKLDKSEMAWLTIPLISLIFTITIYIVGLGTRFDNPMSNNATIIQLNSRGEVSDTLVATGIFGFREGDLNVSFDENTFIKLNPNSNMYINEMRYDDKDIVTKYNLGKQKNIEFKKMGRWSSQVINSSKEIEDIDLKIEDFKVGSKEIRGKINNNSDLNLEDVILLYGSSHYKIGDIDKKFTENINIDTSKLKKSISSNGLYGIVESIYPWTDDMYRQSGLLNKSVKQNMMQEGLFGYMEESSNIAMIIAWNKEAIVDDIDINGIKANRRDRNLIIMPIDINYNTGESVEVPAGVFRPKIEELNKLELDPYGGQLYGDGSVVYSLKANDNIILESMNISISKSPDVPVYIYNYDNEEWDKGDQFKLIVDENNRDIYYRQGQGVKIKFEASPGKENNISEPLFSVKGVGK